MLGVLYVAFEIAMLDYPRSIVADVVVVEYVDVEAVVDVVVVVVDDGIGDFVDAVHAVVAVVVVDVVAATAVVVVIHGVGDLRRLDNGVVV